MRRSVWPFVFAAVLTVPSNAMAGDPPPTVANRQQDLTDLAEFFFPRAHAEALMKKKCTVDYRARMTGSEAIRTIEKKIPGILDRILEAETDYCDRNLQPFLDTSQDKIKSDWTRAVSPADLALLAVLLRHVAQIKAQTGKAEQAIDGTASSTDRERKLTDALNTFTKTAHERQLLEKLEAYKAQVNSDFARAFTAFFEAATGASMRAANSYAVSAGFGAVYPDVPPDAELHSIRLIPLPKRSLLAT